MLTKKSMLVMIRLCQILLLFSFRLAYYYYYNNLGFMRNYSYFSRKVAEGPIGIGISILSLLVVGIICIKGYKLWQVIRKNVSSLVNFSLLLVLGIGFCIWQLSSIRSHFVLFYVVSAIFIVAIGSQFLALNLALKQKKLRNEDGK